MSTTNELFNSFCLALREDIKHRKRQVALHTTAINSIVAVSGGQDDETVAVHTASINDTLADIERQADAAVARIQAMADTTDTDTLRFFEFELEEFVDDAMNDNIDPLVIKRALRQQAAVLDLLIEEGERLRDSNDTEEQS